MPFKNLYFPKLGRHLAPKILEAIPVNSFGQTHSIKDVAGPDGVVRLSIAGIGTGSGGIVDAVPCDAQGNPLGVPVAEYISDVNGISYAFRAENFFYIKFYNYSTARRVNVRYWQ